MSEVSGVDAVGAYPTWLEEAEPEDVLRWAYATYRRPVIVASFQAESSVLIDMAWRLRGGSVEVLTVDTGRLPQETHDAMEAVRQRYGVPVQIETPDPDAVRGLTREHGSNLFYRSPDLRRSCCEVRKTQPLRRALGDHDAWITGLRRDQAATRAHTPVATADPEHGGIAKIAPLARWDVERVWGYLRQHDVPTHPLYQRGYTSIGCAPCTRPTRPGEDARAGRWWWEHDEVKECGLHWR